MTVWYLDKTFFLILALVFQNNLLLWIRRHFIIWLMSFDSLSLQFFLLLWSFSVSFLVLRFILIKFMKYQRVNMMMNQDQKCDLGSWYSKNDAASKLWLNSPQMLLANLTNCFQPFLQIMACSTAYYMDYPQLQTPSLRPYFPSQKHLKLLSPYSSLHWLLLKC